MGLLAAGGIAALLMLPPVQDAIKEIVDGVVGIGNFVTGIAKSINGAFNFLFGGTTPSEATPPESESTPSPSVSPTTTNTETTPPVTTTPTPQSATPAPQESRPSIMSSAMRGAAVGGSIVPVIGHIVGGTVGGITGAFNSATPTSPPTNANTTATPHAAASPSSTTSRPQATPASTNVNPQATSVGGLTQITTASGLTAMVASQYAPNFQGLINDLEAQGYPIRSLGGYSPRNVAGTSKRSYHASGMSIDINAAANPHTFPGDRNYGQTDLPSNVGELARRNGLGWGGNWRSSKDTMHFSAAASEGGSGGSHMHVDGPSGEMTSSLGSTMAAAANMSLEAVGKLFGVLGSAIIKPGVPRRDLGAVIANAAIETNTAVATTRTPTPTPPPPAPRASAPSTPNINRGSSGPTQNVATTADRNSVYYYLRRFGYQELSRPENVLNMGSLA